MKALRGQVRGMRLFIRKADGLEGEWESKGTWLVTALLYFRKHAVSAAGNGECLVMTVILKPHVVSSITGRSEQQSRV